MIEDVRICEKCEEPYRYLISGGSVQDREHNEPKYCKPCVKLLKEKAVADEEAKIKDDLRFIHAPYIPEGLDLGKALGNLKKGEAGQPLKDVDYAEVEKRVIASLSDEEKAGMEGEHWEAPAGFSRPFAPDCLEVVGPEEQEELFQAVKEAGVHPMRPADRIKGADQEDIQEEARRTLRGPGEDNDEGED